MSASLSPPNSSSTTSPNPYVADTPPPIPLEKAVQFRVMRLYKPSLYMAPNLPTLTATANSDPLSAGQLNADFIISPYILLPDSFGDIYIGETFSAYVAVVTGIQDIPLFNVTLSATLQTTNAVHELSDLRSVDGQLSGYAKTLAPYENIDIIINHKLKELGTHTLKATVKFTANKSGEFTTVRKFYRFNVLEPLLISSKYDVTHDKILVQCNVTNISKTQLNIAQVSFVCPIQDAVIESVKTSSKPSTNDDSFDLSKYDAYNIRILNPTESIIEAFVIHLPEPAQYQSYISKPVGYPEINWASTFGECGTLKGPNALPMYPQANDPSQSTVSISCIQPPVNAVVHEPFDILIRITNNTKQNLALKLIHRQSSSKSYSRDMNGLTVIGLSAIQLGTLNIGEVCERNVLVYPSKSGLQEMKDVIAVDCSSGREYVSGTLFKIMVQNIAQ